MRLGRARPQRPVFGRKVPAVPLPVASFTASSTTPNTGDTVTITDSSTNETSRSVNWGDGTTNSSLTHVYSVAGTYTIALTAINSSGSDTQTRTNYIIVSLPVLLSDTFTGTNGTNLTSHTMNVGSGWTVHLGSSPTIQSNKAVPLDDSSVMVIDANAGVADFTLSCDITTPSLGNGFIAGLVFRLTDGNNYYSAIFNTNGVTITIDLGVKNGGTDNNISSTSITLAAYSGTTTTMTVVLSGANITVKLGGTTIVTYSGASFNQTATRCGLISYTNSGANYQQVNWDNFFVQ